MTLLKIFRTDKFAIHGEQILKQNVHLTECFLSLTTSKWFGINSAGRCASLVLVLLLENEYIRFLLI